MAELLTVIAKAILLLLARVDKEKQKSLIVDYYNRLNADPCQLLVQQFQTGSADTAGAAAEKRKSD